MDANGKVHIGSDYREKVGQAERMTGKRDSELFRTIVDNILYDAQKFNADEIPVQEIGIKRSAATPK